MIINNPNAPFIPPFNPFIVPSSFYDSWSQEEQIVYLADNKQGRLIPGTGVYIVDNGDGTYTISSDGGTGEGHTYEVRSVAHPSEGNVAEYKLIDLLTGEQSGVTITVPDVNGIASIVTQQSVSKAIVTINMTNGTSKSFDVYYGQDGQDGVSPAITVRDITGGHQIEIVSASGTETFNVMDGTPGAPGAEGATPNISVSGSVLPMGSSALPVVTVTKTGTPENPNFDFLFANLKGQPGPAGPAPDITVTDITGGHRIVIVSGSGTETFDVMDGADGDDGYSPTVIVTPISGGHHVAISTVEGTEEFDVMDGTTPNITITASVLSISGSVQPMSPSVTVTKTGTNENPNFEFEFEGLNNEGGDSLPSGGNKGQVLGIKSESPRELGWTDQYPKILATPIGGYTVKLADEPYTFIAPAPKVKMSNINIASSRHSFTFDLTNVSDTTIPANTVRLTLDSLFGRNILTGHSDRGNYSYDITDMNHGLYRLVVNETREMSPNQTFSYEVDAGGSSSYIDDVSDMRFIKTEPSGGTTGQVLTKNSDNDFDFIWRTPGGGGTSFDYIDWVPIPSGALPDFSMTKHRLTLSNDNSTPITYSSITLRNCSCEIYDIPYDFDLTISLNSLEEMYVETYNVWIKNGEVQLSVDSPPVMYRDSIATWSSPPCTAQISNPSLTLGSIYIAPQYADMSQGIIFIDWNNSSVELSAGGDSWIFQITQIHPGTIIVDSFEPDDSSHLESSSTSGDYCLGPKTVE